MLEQLEAFAKHSQDLVEVLIGVLRGFLDEMHATVDALKRDFYKTYVEDEESRSERQSGDGLLSPAFSSIHNNASLVSASFLDD